MSDIQTTENWFTRHAKAEAKKDTISYSDRIGNIIGIVISFMILLYFVAHQLWSTGFFTAAFGPVEIFLFYLSMIIGIVSSAVKALVGRKNFGRLVDVSGTILGVIVLVWFLAVFPFDFTYFADVLPDFLRFLVQWISNDVARVLIVLGTIAAIVSAIYSAILYVFVRRELSKPIQETV